MIAAPDRTPRTFYGIGASPGIIIGRVRLLGRRRSQRHEHVVLPPERIAPEVARFKAAVDRAEAQLTAARQQFVEQLAGYAAIIDSHLLMLRDRMVFDRTVAAIVEEGIDAEWALEKALNQSRAAFAAIDDPYLRERVHDVEQVAERIFRQLAEEGEEGFADLEERVVLVARDFAPEEILRMQADRVLGFVAEQGGATSHSAIVARTLGIPSVVGAEAITRAAASGDLIVMDGASGLLHLHPTQDQLDYYRECQQQYERYSAEVATYTHLAAETIDGLAVRVEANIGKEEEAALALEYGAGGIGLFRSEYTYLNRETVPDEEELYELYRGLLVGLSPLPVTIRTLDAGGDKFPASMRWAREMNPALGLRAIRFSLREPAIFAAQLRALLRAGLHGRLRIMFPMITSLCEVQRAKELIASAQEELRREGKDFAARMPVGVMVEVPSAVSVADVLAREVDFFSIGTNDLIQYALAIDRGNEQVAHMYEPLHPAVLRMIRQVVEAGHAAGIPVAMCGEMAGDLSLVPVLLGLGLDELSMHPYAIPYVKRMIRQSTAEECERLAVEVLACPAAQEVHDCLNRYLPLRYPEEFGRRGLRRLKGSCCAVVRGGTEQPVAGDSGRYCP
ncbi:MAG: phosphoenolpyruvate--protein phosphotransferase [Thermodesulfobacteriota bacterium]